MNYRDPDSQPRNYAGEYADRMAGRGGNGDPYPPPHIANAQLDQLRPGDLTVAQRRAVDAALASEEMRLRGYCYDGWDRKGRPCFSADRQIAGTGREQWALTKGGNVAEPVPPVIM